MVAIGLFLIVLGLIILEVLKYSDISNELEYTLIFLVSALFAAGVLSIILGVALLIAPSLQGMLLNTVYWMAEHPIF